MSTKKLHTKLSTRTSGPHLSMVIEPETKYRFRYGSEGGSHGGLSGKQNGNRKKVYPTVKLDGYEGNKNVYIRVGLYTEDKEQHVFEFIGQNGSTSYIEEYLQDNIAIFKNLKFLSKKKEEVFRLLMDQKMEKLKDNNKCVRARFEKQYYKELNEKARNMMNSVRLCFEAFEEGNHISLCDPLYSDPICNQKTASRGELKIHRISAFSGSWKGGDDVILLCDKVQKENIEIHFFETGCDKELVWKEKAKFTPLDVHYQVAITFKTPPYRENADKKVSVCLARNGEFSKPVEFTYIADNDGYPSKKRRKYSATSSYSESFMCSTSDESQQIDDPISLQELSMTDNDTPSSGIKFDTDLLNLVPKSFVCSTSDELQQIGDPISSQELLMTDNDTPSSGIKFDADLMNLFQNIEEYNPEMFNELLFSDPILQDEIDGGHIVGQMDIGPVMEGESTLSSLKLKSMNKSKTNNYLQSDLQNVKEKIYEHLMKRDDFGNTLLHIAASKNKNDVSLILQLIKFANADIINEKNYYQETALHLAVEQNNIKLIKSFLKHGSNPNLKNSEGNNCYHIASQESYVDAMDSLFGVVRYKPEVNACNYEGLTPLHISVMKHSENCYHLLKPHLSDVNTLDKKAGRSLLHYAVEFHSPFVTILLKEKEIDVNSQDFGGNTPLHIACVTGKIEVVKQLLKAGADPFLKNYKKNCNTLEEEISEDDMDGQTPADVTTDSEILEILIQASQNPSGLNETIEKLCNLLDVDMRWKDVAMYFMDEKYISSLLCSPSPTQALLLHIQKEKKDSYIEHLKTVLEITGLSEALEIIQEKHF